MNLWSQNDLQLEPCRYTEVCTFGPLESPGIPKAAQGPPNDPHGTPRDPKGPPRDPRGIPEDPQGRPRDPYSERLEPFVQFVAVLAVLFQCCLVLLMNSY